MPDWIDRPPPKASMIVRLNAGEVDTVLPVFTCEMFTVKGTVKPPAHWVEVCPAIARETDNRGSEMVIPAVTTCRGVVVSNWL